MTERDQAAADDVPPGGRRISRLDGLAVVAVLAGGAVGTALRLGADAALPPAPDGPPWSTSAVNVLGCLLLGMLVGRMPLSAPEWLRAGLGAGLLGSFTTFSALAVAVVQLGSRDAGGIALVYVAMTVITGLAAAAAGLALGGSRQRDGIPRPIGSDE